MKEGNWLAIAMVLLRDAGGLERPTEGSSVWESSSQKVDMDTP